MKINITKRDIKFFIIGIVTMLIIDFFSDLDNNIKAIKDGYETGRSEATLFDTNE